jgi:hypothetical protein
MEIAFSRLRRLIIGHWLFDGVRRLTPDALEVLHRPGNRLVNSVHNVGEYVMHKLFA